MLHCYNYNTTIKRHFSFNQFSFKITEKIQKLTRLTTLVEVCQNDNNANILDISRFVFISKDTVSWE